LEAIVSVLTALMTISLRRIQPFTGNGLREQERRDEVP
jgi:hypothetical protein